MVKGKFIVISGLDGVGKGVVEEAICNYESGRRRKVFDVIAYSKSNGKLPELNDFFGGDHAHSFDVVRTAEPSYCGIGAVIRNEIISKNGRDYSPDVEIDAYSLDRVVLMKRIVKPSLDNGIDVVQSRCFLDTLCYQGLRAQSEGLDFDLTIKKILEKDGSKIQLEYRPDLIIIPTIKDVDALIRRIEERKSTGKDDNAIFENADFQLKLKPYFDSSDLLNIFKNRGTKIIYLDAGISIESTKSQAIKAYSDFINNRKF